MIAPLEAVKAAISHVAEHPEEHDQALWLNTDTQQRCIGGWILHYAGIPIRVNCFTFVKVEDIPEKVRGEFTHWATCTPTEVLAAYLNITWEQCLTITSEMDEAAAVKLLKETMGLC